MVYTYCSGYMVDNPSGYINYACVMVAKYPKALASPTTSLHLNEVQPKIPANLSFYELCLLLTRNLWKFCMVFMDRLSYKIRKKI